MTAPPSWAGIVDGSSRRLCALLGGLVLGLGVVLLSPGTAAVAGGNDDLGAPPALGEKPPVVQHRCVLYANPRGFGADCAGGSRTRTIKQILGGEPFPECRDELLTDDSPPPTHDLEKGAWYLETCLKGIKPDGTGDFTRTTEMVWFPEGKPVPVLTQNQNEAWSIYRSKYPSPMAEFGPASAPRVLIPTYFWLTQDTGSVITRTVFDGVRDVPMRARVAAIEVSPGVKDGEEAFTCRNTPEHPLLPYDHSRSINDQPSTCHFEYKRSSANKADHIYEVIVQADWVVEYQRLDGTWGELGAFPLSQTTKTPVNEIQTVVG